MQNHPLQCACGKFKGHVNVTGTGTRGLCYCRDCQAFAHFLGKSKEVLDAHGGTDIVPTNPMHVTFTEGLDQLTCLRLTPKGLVRWYTRCCNSPIGNTMADQKMSYVGLVHTILRAPGASLDDSFGPIRMWINQTGTEGEVPSSALATLKAIAWMLKQVATARFSGTYRQTPFFDSNGQLVATPYILTPEELARVKPAKA